MFMSAVPRAAVGAALALALVLQAVPASAHEEISPVTVPTGKAVFLTLLAANETRSALNRITLTAPSGVEYGGATRQPAGWTGQRSGTTVTWSGGSLAPGAFEEWGFEIEAVDQPGPLRFRVASAYASGGTDTHTVVIDVVAAGTTPTTTSAPTVTVGTAPEDTADTTAAPEAAAPESDSDSSGMENVAVGLAGVAVVLALVALVAAVRGGRNRAGEARDW